MNQNSYWGPGRFSPRPADCSPRTSPGSLRASRASLSTLFALGQAPRTLFATTPYGFFAATRSESGPSSTHPAFFQRLLGGRPVQRRNGVRRRSLGPVPQHGQRQPRSITLSSMAGPMHRRRPGRTLDAVRRKRYTFDATIAFAGIVHKSTDGGSSWSDLNTTSLVDGIGCPCPRSAPARHCLCWRQHLLRLPGLPAGPRHGA
jgi:hypothetical protein